MNHSADPFLATVRALTDAKLLESLPHYSRAELLDIHSAFGPEECDCELEPLDCGCEESCDCAPDYAPCPHFRSFYLSWPVLKALCERLWPEPPAPDVKVFSRDPASMAVEMARRFGAGQALRLTKKLLTDKNRKDGPDEILTDADDRIARRIERLRNGSDVAGVIGFHAHLSKTLYVGQEAA